ncbi:CinA family protein [Gulosibacter molinativorax]|uniref:CinA family protein n=1 Tax=Gulosibacter molinativorax TaxID=256821 RepID=A0ABT7C7Z1_9MICO|nr:CinA family protein [Gulosibacter molinativorax]MDJ1371299.1 CinA family protein [Gulosibacter molinativorax]QUY63637.1 Putative competence-and mitomycin-induced protein [Gulosibacter molinativorax]
MSYSAHDLPDLIADQVEGSGTRVALAESLTCGTVAGMLGRGHGTSAWLRGGIVAYSTEIKQRVLGVSPGPVVTARCAEEMAAGAAKLFDAEITVSTTGVGGPGSQEGRPAGTVFVGWYRDGQVGSTEYLFAGDPERVLDQTVSVALQRLYEITSDTKRTATAGDSNLHG